MNIPLCHATNMTACGFGKLKSHFYETVLRLLLTHIPRTDAEGSPLGIYFIFLSVPFHRSRQRHSYLFYFQNSLSFILCAPIMNCETFWCVEAYRGGTGMAVALPWHSRRVNAKVHVYKVSSLILYTFEYNENYYKGSHFHSCIFSWYILTSYRLSGFKRLRNRYHRQNSL